jgi:flagellar export protein FliJ
VKSLDTIIRLHKWKLDERRRALGELQALSDQLGAEIVRLDGELEREKAIATETPASSIDLAGYLKAMLTRRAHLKVSQTHVDKQIAAAQDEIANAFAELKRFELAKADRDRRAAQKQRKIEMAAFDEIALDGYRRRRTADPAA